ncbi:MAG: HlyD family secretion protein [Bacteroidota bacterium]
MFQKLKKKWYWVLIIVAVLIWVVARVRGGGEGAEKVAVGKAVKRTIIESVNASGKVYPEVEVKISPDISGEITELNVEEGDSVMKGQVLARIYADIYALQRDEASSRVQQTSASVRNTQEGLEGLRAGLEQAQLTFDRNKKLYDDKVISKSELEQYETSVRSARANVRAAEQTLQSLQASVQGSRVGLSRANKDLGRTTLTAPMSGVISSLKVKKGERVAGNSFNIGTEMMTVADMSIIEVRVDVGENDIVKIHIGDSADVEVDAYSKRKFKGVVTKIASSTKSGNALTSSNDVTNYEVRIRLDASSYQDLLGQRFPFRPGMNASADIKTRRVENVLAVPIAAVSARLKGGDETLAAKKKEQSEAKGMDQNADMELTGTDLEEVVFVTQPNGTVKKVVVTTGVQDINYIQILSGLKGNEEVVVAPFAALSKTLKDGGQVNVVPKEKLFEKK